MRLLNESFSKKIITIINTTDEDFDTSNVDENIAPNNKETDYNTLKKIHKKFGPIFTHYIHCEDGPLPLVMYVFKLPQTAGENSSYNKKLRYMKFMLEHGADANATDKSENSVLHLIAEDYSQLVLNEVKENIPLDNSFFAHIEKQHEAKIYYIKAALQLFLQHGALLSKKNGENLEPLELIRREHSKEQPGLNNIQITNQWKIYEKFRQYCHDALTAEQPFSCKKEPHHQHIQTCSM